MTASSGPKGRLPARVYWFRRALVISTALALVFGIAHLLNGSPSPEPTANLNSSKQSPTQGATTGSAVDGPVAAGTSTKHSTATTTALAQPDGPCAIEDVTVAPVAGTGNAGSTVPLTVQLTGVRPACTFDVNSNSIVAKVVRNGKRVWSSQDCPSAITKASVVVRSGTPTTVEVPWSGRYSDATCSQAGGWALPGNYQVAAAAIGSEPSTAALKLSSPPRPVVTKTAKPKTPAKTKKTTKNTPSKKPTKKATPDSGR